VKYADDLVLVAKEEKVLQGMMDRLIEIGRCSEMEMNVEKLGDENTKANIPPPQIMVDQKQLGNVEYFNYLSSVTTNGARCTGEIKSRNAMVKEAFNKKKNFSPANWT
jgi:hypothetical protein